MDIGQKIRIARIEKGMTQEELGNILGVKKSSIAKYESGIRGSAKRMKNEINIIGHKNMGEI